ncbi:uncharacterized protein C4orf50 homolog [Meriones unguiculatus]|uniref:uncharacterized protein C4orf50 homolog n=1 Tax=Meriones unguiculatus TaxID=10047 RepID=UPI0010860FDD|nr:uncharacterized protein C4orf50 homolog [Meriones unguiculatus]XP_060221393.1 uncharacterized protein C4orf50 homolog [Meriones unguiculatus]XP_060221394.1 uncharacterized protein C4orf50 homolog [Meriones unguiculatus]
MEPTDQGQTEKSFRYVIRAPSSDGSDVINVDVKIDTCWVFRDVEESDKEQGCLPEAASSLHLDTGLLREQLESSERKLLAAVDKHVISESGLRNRVQELELSERRLLLKVEQLSACVAQERSASLHAQEQLQALQGELVSWVQEAESAARRQRRLQERLRRKDEALARQAATLERCGRVQRQQLGLVREQERVLRAQVQRMERDVQRLGRAAGLLLAQLQAPDPLPSASSSGPQLQADPPGVPEAAELNALRARAERAERERAEAARRLREHSATERQLREQLEELRCCVYGLTLSEIGLHSQVEELAQQNRRLRSQLGHGSPGALDCAQSDSLPRSRAEVLDPCSSQGRHSDAHGCQVPAGQLSEESCGCAEGGAEPCMVVPVRTRDKLQRDPPGSEHRQGTLLQRHLGGQVLWPLYGCPPGPSTDEPLCSLNLAGVSETLQDAGAQEPLLFLPISMLQLWGPAREPEILLPSLLQERPLHELQTQEDAASKPSPAPEALTHPGWHCNLARSHDTFLSQESRLISNGSFLTKGPKEQRDVWKERGGPPAASAEKLGAMGTLDGIKSEMDDKCPLVLESSEKLILDTEVQAPDSMQEGSKASDTQAEAHFPCFRSDCLLLPLHGMTPRSQEGPESLSKRGSMGGYGWELLENLSSEEEEGPSFSTHGTREPRINGTQLPAGKGKEVWRRTQGEKGHQLCFGDTQLLQKERSGYEEQEKEVKVQVTFNPASVGISERPEFKADVGQEQCLLMGDQDLLQVPKWTSADIINDGSCPSQALIIGQNRYALQTDTLKREVEACFQELNNLKIVCGDPQQVSELTGESQSITHMWWGTEEGVCLQQPSASQDLNAERNRNGERVRLEEDVAPHTGEVLPGAALDGDKANWGPAELGGSQFPPTWRTGSRFHQLLANLKGDRDEVSLDNARLQGEQEGCHHEGCCCEKERTREAAKALRLEQANHRLQGELAHLKRELEQCLQAVSDLEDCNGKSYCKISQLEEENEKLKGDLGQLHKAVSENVRKARGRMKHVALENRELRALISELGVSYKGLIKDTMVGIEDMVWALQEENKHLVDRVQGLEQEVLQMSKGLGEEKWYPQGNSKMEGDCGHTEDKEIQVTMFSRQLITRACGSPLNEKSGVTGGQAGHSLDLEDSRGKAVVNTVSSVCAVTEGPQEAHTNGARGDGARLQKEQKTPSCSRQQGQPQGSLTHSPQLQKSKATASEEDPELCIQRLHHQVRTLQCQLRDQGWTLRELQAARDEAVGLQDKLKVKLEELWEQQQEARLAMGPLKAKLASLVHKCQERNRLIEHLLQELPRHEPKKHLLFELAQNMLDDVALAEYTATFLTPGAPETGHHLDVSSNGTAARGGAQDYLLNSETDSVLQRLWGVESWSPPGTEWISQTGPPGSPKERRQHHQAHHAGQDECLSQMTNGAEVAL